MKRLSLILKLCQMKCCGNWMHGVRNAAVESTTLTKFPDGNSLFCHWLLLMMKKLMKTDQVRA